jgi:hypothetical protein
MATRNKMNVNLINIAVFVLSVLYATKITAQESQTPTKPGNCNSNTLSGENNIQINSCPTFDVAPAPKAKIVKAETVAPTPDGRYVWTIVIDIVAPYPPVNMIISAVGSNVVELQVEPGGRFNVGEGHWNPPKFGRFYFFDRPAGEHTVRIFTTDATSKPRIEIGFNVQTPTYTPPR